MYNKGDKSEVTHTKMELFIGIDEGLRPGDLH